MKKIIGLLLCVFLLCTSVTFLGCGFDKSLLVPQTPQLSGPEQAIEDFEKAFNERDIDGIIKFFKPSEQAEIKLSFKLMEAIYGSSGDLFGADLSSFWSEDMFSGLFGTALGDYYIDIQIVDIVYDSTNTKATVSVNIVSDVDTEADVFEMVKISDKWYSDLNINEN